jgi:hypothetical protein
MLGLLNRRPLISLMAGAALSGGFAFTAEAQPLWETAVVQGTYAVYSTLRETNQVMAEQEYFLQTFAGQTTTIVNHTFSVGTQTGERRVTETPFLCEGTYTLGTPFPGFYQATCGDEVYDLMPTAMEIIDGALVVTEMLGVNRVSGTAAGERLQYQYVRLPEGFEDAIVLGTYATTHHEEQRGQLYLRSMLALETWDADGHVTYFNGVRTLPGEEPGTRIAEEDRLVCEGVYTPNPTFVGIHQKTCGNGIWDLLVLRIEEIGGVLIVTEFTGFDRSRASVETAHMNYWRLPE